MAANRVGIYEIVNLLNGKRYIGSTVAFADRFGTHRRALRNGRHHSQHLQRSWNKNGVAAFAFRPILICSRATLLFYEQICIDSLKPEYNVLPTAGSRLGIKNTPEHNAKIGAAHRGKKRGPLSKETRQKLREIGLKANRPPPPMSAEVKERVDAGKRGRKQSPESIAKRVIGLKTVMSDPCYRERAVASLHSNREKAVIGICRALRTTEFRLQTSKRFKDKWADETFRAKTVTASKAAQDDEWRMRHAAGIARVQADPSFHERRNAGLAQYLASKPKPEARPVRKVDVDEWRRNQSAAAKARCQDPAWRQKLADAGKRGREARWGKK